MDKFNLCMCVLCWKGNNGTLHEHVYCNVCSSAYMYLDLCVHVPWQERNNCTLCGKAFAICPVYGVCWYSVEKEVTILFMSMLLA
jgi:hypothetical protein